MAHLWLQNDAHEWTAHELASREFPLESFLNNIPERNPALDSAPADVKLLKAETDNQDNWVIVAGHGSGISINGIPLFLGIRTLRDRDEIRWRPDGFIFFSSEELAAVVDFPQSDRKIVCPRCKQEIEPGTPAVLCPGCKIYYHQSEQLPCYTYAENCGTCTRKTNLGSGYEWIPEQM
jgi:hypothetical protein